MEVLNDLTAAIFRNNNIHDFHQIVINASREWCRKQNSFGHTILQVAIQLNRTEIFDYILQFQDTLDLETVNSFGETALMFVLNDWNEWNESREYYACELIKKGAFIHTICKNDSFLHQAVEKSSMKVTELLLEKGIDVNAVDRDGRTALHNMVFNRPHRECYEFVAALLYYGADPLIECSLDDYNPCEHLNAFEHSILYSIDPIKEILFLYTFDKYTRCEIRFKVILTLAYDKSPLFHQIFEYDVEFVNADLYNYSDLFYIDIDYLKILLKNCNPVIIELFKKINNDLQYDEYDHLNTAKWYHHVSPSDLSSILEFNLPYVDFKELKTEDWFYFITLRNLSFILEYNETMKTLILNILGNVSTISFKVCLDWVIREDISEVTELLMYMFSYGLPCTSHISNTVFKYHGHCQLFKYLLFLDVDQNIDKRVHPSSMAAFVYDINLDLEKYLEKNTRLLESADQVLNYFAHSKLSDLLIKKAEELNLLHRIEKFQNHPRIPRLVELSRNAFRKHFVQKLNIKTCREFYSRINELQISTVYKSIITYETKLY